MSDSLDLPLVPCDDVMFVPCDLIIDPDSCRNDTGGLDELRATIEEVGLLENLVVTQTRAGYELLAGHRRMTVCRFPGWKCVPCKIIPLVSSKPIQIQFYENTMRKNLTRMEAVKMARRLRPLVQAAALEREKAGVKTAEATGATREIVAKRVGISHETLRKADYVWDRRDSLQAQRDEATKEGRVPGELQELARKFEDLWRRMYQEIITISEAYKQAKAMIEGQQFSARTPRLIQVPILWTSESGQPMQTELTLKLPKGAEPTEPFRSALQEAIASQMQGIAPS